MKRNESAIRWGVYAVLGVVLAAASGRLTFHLVNDSPSYLEYPLGNLTEMLLSIRTPGYPVLVAMVRSTLGLSAMPIVQVLLHATAAWALGEELQRRSMPARGAVAAALCVLVGCTAMDNISTISTDAPGASFGVLTAVLLMQASRKGGTGSWIACGLLGLVAIAIRPAYLFLLPWMTVAGWMLVKHDGGSQWRRTAGFRVSLVVFLVLIGWMSLRKSVVNDFALVPFGHQNLSAILVQTVPLETLRSLTGDGGELSVRVADELEQECYESPGQGGGLATLTIERQWDVINYHVILPIARELELQRSEPKDHLNVRVHRRVAAMNHQILSASKRGYARWLLLGMRRAAWGVAANLVMHPIFLGAIVISIAWLWVRCLSDTPLNPLVIPKGWSAFAIVAITYAAMKIGFVILTSPPLGRFADAGAIFLPGLVACLFVGSRDPSDL